MSYEVEVDQEAIETVKRLIKGIDIAMLASITEQGIVARPMKTQEVEFDGDLWFLTMRDTDKYEELVHNPHVNVTYVGDSYVSIRGTAELVNDRDKIKEYWNLAYEKLLDTTSDDPNLILIKVKAETAEYWDMGNKMKLAKKILSKITGKGSEDTNTNNVVNLQGN